MFKDESNVWNKDRFANIETKTDARKRGGWSGEGKEREDDYGEMISAESSLVSGEGRL